MSGQPVVAALVALPVASAILVLPGFGAVWLAGLRRRGPTSGRVDRVAEHEPRAAGLVVAVCVSLACVVILGGLLLAFRIFSPTRLAVAVAALAACGVVPAIRWVRRNTVALPHAVLLLVAAAPFAFVVFEPGYKPALSYQWFYWHLGQELQSAHGIPSFVREWGALVRWQPDYLNFDILSQAFLGGTPGIEPASAVAAWKLPLAVLLLAATFLLLRLWFSRFGAALGTIGLGATDVYVDKLTNNTPEALGLAFGFLCVWLGVQAIRRERPAWLMLAGGTIGLTVSVHAIAATVSGMLLVAAIMAELATRRRGTLRWLGCAAVAAILTVAVFGGLGFALQGRASPLGGAGKPRVVSGVDPTYQFLKYSNGHFGHWAVKDALWPNIDRAWTGITLFSGRGIVLVVLMALGVLAAVFRPRTAAARGVMTAVIAAVFLAAGIVWFLHYDTYVPQHTGRSRLSDYAVVVEVVLLAAGVDALANIGRVAAMGRIRARRVSRVLRLASAVALVLAAFLVCAFPTAARVDGRTAMSASGRAALAKISTLAPEGAVVVSNAATRGTVEFFTGLENPLEGRQPLIEDLAILVNASAYLERMHAFLTDPHPGELASSLGAGWMILSAQPRELGTGLQYAAPAADFARRAGLEVVWSDGGVQILRGAGADDTVRSVGAARPLGARFLLVLAAVVVLAGAAVALTRRLLAVPRSTD